MDHIVCSLPLILVFFSCKVRYWICSKIIQTKRLLIPNIQARTWKLIYDMTKAARNVASQRSYEGLSATLLNYTGLPWTGLSIKDSLKDRAGSRNQT